MSPTGQSLELHANLHDLFVPSLVTRKTPRTITVGLQFIIDNLDPFQQVQKSLKNNYRFLSSIRVRLISDTEDMLSGISLIRSSYSHRFNFFWCQNESIFLSICRLYFLLHNVSSGTFMCFLLVYHLCPSLSLVWLLGCLVFCFGFCPGLSVSVY